MVSIEDDFMLGVLGPISSMMEEAFIEISESHYKKTFNLNFHDDGRQLLDELVKKKYIERDLWMQKYPKNPFKMDIEHKATLYYHCIGLFNDFKKCISASCNSDNVLFLIKQKKYRCNNCKKEWSEKEQSILEGSKIDPFIFLTSLRFYECEIPLKTAMDEGFLALSKSTMVQLHHYFRKCIADPKMVRDLGFTLDPNHVFVKSVDEKNACNSDPVIIGIQEVDRDSVSMSILENLSYNDIIENRKIKKLLWGPIIITDKYDKFATMLIYGLKPKSSERYSKEPEDIYISITDFWKFMNKNERLLHHVNTDTGRFILYINELVYRYQHRHEVLFGSLYKAIARKNYIYTSEEEIVSNNYDRLIKLEKN